MYKYIFDLDNTLVFTDDLNNEAYNYALKFLGKERISDVKRITREIVFSKYNLTKSEKKDLVKLKQAYFADNINKINKNEDLLNLILELGPAECILWTKADECRVNAILEYLNLNDAFSWVLYSKKTDTEKDIEKICRHFKCAESQLKFYEDNIKICNKLKNHNVAVV